MSATPVINPVEPFLRSERLPHIWCPGCGIGTTVNCFARALARIIHERSFEGEIFADPAFKSDHGRKLSSASTDSGEVSDVRGWIPALRETSGQAG